ncbi:sodium/calcium exchanger 3-like isoform X1 [Haliotis cracherodii]|uniref:sodium/calcium exchanger 3-like isoform X1 n=1 Tax=Haliotis cracherodii TaxID=6455 RepID=UPI0039E974F0
MNATIDLDVYTCSKVGLMLPMISEYTWSIGARAFLYFLAMIWCFLGVAIISDTFMCGIERITSKTRVIKIPDSEDKDKFKDIEVKVWNDTVANLSLLAFGTSAPEILLSVIEITGKGFKSGELGPGTIVGSAAFNLLVITAVCIVSIPKGEVRRIKNIKVFAITSFSSMFAYIWLLIVLLLSSPEVVDLWEAVITFLFFPALIIIAYVTDKGCCCKSNRTASEVEIGLAAYPRMYDLNGQQQDGTADIIEVARECGRGDRKMSLDAAAQIAAARIAERQTHNSAWYRVNATRVITGGHKLTPPVNKAIKDLYENVVYENGNAGIRKSSLDISESGKKAVIEFTAASCAVLENEGHVRLGVRRSGDVESSITVGVETIDGSAEAGSDYKPIKQKLTFGPKECLKDVYVEIVDDDVWEPDEFFFVKLFLEPEQVKGDEVVLGKVSINQVTIVNDDEPGKFEFSKPSYIVKEGCGQAQVVVKRVNGADGEVAVTWKTKDLSAKSGQEYQGGEDKIRFKHGETSKVVTLDIFGIKNSHEPNFQVDLSSPTGGAEVGKISRAIVTIINDEEFSAMVSRIQEKTEHNLQGLKIDTATWGDQFHDAMNVNGGDVENASALSYIMHFTTFFWKVLFAFVPPPSIGGGWLTFLVSLAMIGLLTALISDLASIFGCLIGLSPTITAITFVALGTSMPDTFASRQAAMMERFADSSIGNINGSNSVNVFLGLGFPWLIATIYWQIKGVQFKVAKGSLVFSVILYTISSVVAISVLLLRRNLPVMGKAELGGPKAGKIGSAIFVFLMWVLYIVLSSLQAQNIINVI